MPQEKTRKGDLQVQPTRSPEQSKFRTGGHAEKEPPVTEKPAAKNNSAKAEAVEDLLSLLSRI